MELTKLNQRIELIKWDQLMMLTKLNQDIQSWWISRCSVMKDDKTLNRDRQNTQSHWAHLGFLFEV